MLHTVKILFIEMAIIEFMLLMLSTTTLWMNGLSLMVTFWLVDLCLSSLFCLYVLLVCVTESVCFVSLVPQA